MIPVGLPVGVFAGLSIHSVLVNLVSGQAGIPWTHRSLPILLGILGACGAYFSYCYTPVEDYMWIQRVDVKSGQRFCYNPRTGAILPGSAKVTESTVKRLEKVVLLK